MAEQTADRLTRMLAMMALLGTGETFSVNQLAQRFAVTPAQVEQDIDTLMVSGIPGYFSNDLIDFDLDSFFDKQLVVLRDGQGVERPLRLAAREAVSILAALQAIAAMLDVAGEEYALVTGLIAKVKQATDTTADAIDIEINPQQRAIAAHLRAAIAARQVVKLSYARADDILSTRAVEPLVLTVADEHTYLVAWSREANAERLYRLDRIVAAEVTEQQFAPRPVAPRVPFAGKVHGEQVCIHVRARARWVAEDLPTERVVDTDDATVRVWLRMADEAWLRQLLLRIAADVIEVLPSRAARGAATAARAALAAYRELG